MVGLVILYDHVHPQGAFVKASNVDVSILVRSNDTLPLHVFCIEENQICFLLRSCEDYRLNTWDQCPAWFGFFSWNHVVDVLCGVSSVLFMLGLVRVKKLVVQADDSSQLNAKVYNAWTLTYTLFL